MSRSPPLSEEVIADIMDTILTEAPCTVAEIRDHTGREAHETRSAVNTLRRRGWAENTPEGWRPTAWGRHKVSP